MKLTTYPCPLAAGGHRPEYAVAFDAGRARRLLVVPALLDEAHKLRRLTLETMRRLDGAGIDCLLPDLPGTNESTQPLASLDPEDWATAIAAAARSFGPTHILALRGGATLVPPGLPGWLYAPVSGAGQLRVLLRARAIAEREAGREASPDRLLEAGLAEGIELAGYRLSAEMLRQMQGLAIPERANLSTIAQDTIGGTGLWLRAEPGESPSQADALAAAVAVGLAA